jgi:hypothetical protein
MIRSNAEGVAHATRRESWRHWRRQIAECVVLPALAAVMPWPLAWRTLRTLARRGWFFEAETASAYATCSSLGVGGNDESWTIRHRLTRFVDHVDPALSATRGDRWMNRYLVVEGDTLPATPCVFIGFHYGTAFWSLRHLRRHGHRVAFLSAPLDASRQRAEPLRFAFTRWRQNQVARAGGAPIIYVGGSADRIRASLGQGISVLALIDVPEPTTSTVPVQVLGHELRFPDGILRIGASENVPILGFIATLDPGTGVRRLRFARLPSAPGDAVHALAALLDTAIRDDPAAWHFWAQWPRLRHRRPVG